MQFLSSSLTIHISQFNNITTVLSKTLGTEGQRVITNTIITYMTDMRPAKNVTSKDIYYGDGITHTGASDGTLKDHDTLVQEAIRVNNFERTWKVQTNTDKFALLAPGSKLLDI